jgi:hypothetical protein
MWAAGVGEPILRRQAWTLRVAPQLSAAITDSG